MDDVFINSPELRTGFNYDTNIASDASGLKCEDVSLTKQSDAEAADINTIVRRFNISGMLPVQELPPQFGDFTDVVDFQTAMNAVVLARETFEALPADLRSRFHNDPVEFVDFTDNKDNLDEMRKLGLAKPVVAKAPEPGPLRVTVVEDQRPKAGAAVGGGTVVT